MVIKYSLESYTPGGVFPTGNKEATSLREVKQKRLAPIYIFAVVWVLCTLIFPMHKLIGILLTAVISLAALYVSKKLFKPKTIQVEEPEPKKEEPEAVSYGPEVDAIIAEGKIAQREMARLYNSIKEPAVRMKISKLMLVSDKIVEDAIHDPSDVPQIKKFLSYYLPTTIKLLNAYDRMGAQGIQGENISGTMQSIEQMLDTAIAAYEKQLDSLFANQAMDIETDIHVMNAMLKREGLGEKEF